MKRVRRGARDIMLELLDVIESGTSQPTRIMYDTHISWGTLQKYLKRLEEKELIRVVDFPTKEGGKNKVRYFPTNKGTEVLALGKELQTVL